VAVRTNRAQAADHHWHHVRCNTLQALKHRRLSEDTAQTPLDTISKLQRRELGPHLRRRSNGSFFAAIDHNKIRNNTGFLNGSGNGNLGGPLG